MGRPRDHVPDPCPEGEHVNAKHDVKCDVCGCDLCPICLSGEHWASDGHDLSDPRYWGV